MPEQRTPDASKIDHGDYKARELYMIAFAGAINHFDYERYQSAAKLAMGNVCAAFEQDGLSIVGVTYFSYKLDVALWEIYFGDLGNDKPPCPWTTGPAQNLNDEPAEEYNDWRCQRGLTDSTQSEMDVSGDGPDGQEGNPEDPVPTFESLQRAYQETVTVANVAAELATQNVEKVKSIANLVDERRLLQERVESLEEELNPTGHLAQ
ncbi:hypothetical protein FANTH_12652 [Fusarium anthophilum]|uniref:Uncharacterized protein n=1 Tax=Fusarium anthophilum TaxID=48485 RepID=A0A8H4YSE1_9HYPO|nr:hypothetical protein FANTH_12652 [Fusarium anthophilum]